MRCGMVQNSSRSSPRPEDSRSGMLRLRRAARIKRVFYRKSGKLHLKFSCFFDSGGGNSAAHARKNEDLHPWIFGIDRIRSFDREEGD